jgi:putative intracellular protease/amidase
MRATRRRLLKAGAAAVALGGAAPFSLGQDAPKKVYVCPPCACGRDHEEFDRPGACPACGMALVLKGSPAAAPAPAGAGSTSAVRAAVLIFDGVQVIDFAAPYEVFGQAGYEVFTVALEARPVLTSMSLRVTPRYTLADAPAAEIVLVPGGDVGGVEGEPRVLDWLRERSRTATHVVSVCNGAFILAAAGLLDGLEATTFYDLIDGLRARAPKTRVVSDRRYVDNGKVITTAGLSSGIDGALHVVSRLSGPARAQMAALNMEYDWKADGRYARASFADVPVRRLLGRRLALPLPAPERAEVVSTSGDRTRWEVVWSVATRRPPEAVRTDAAAAIDSFGTWTRGASAATGGGGPSWTLTDAGSRFRARLTAAADAAAVRISLQLERDGA